MDIVVLGAGVIGVTTAYYLARDGHSVTVIDRQAAAGLETSFANGSQIAAHTTSPWSAPGVPLNVLKWLGREDAPLLLRLRSIPGLWRWGPQFLMNCTEDAWMENARSLLRLAQFSQNELNEIVATERISYDELKRGILVVHRTQQTFDAAVAQRVRWERLGSAPEVLDSAACVAVEPALQPIGDQIVGGIYSPGDQTGDCLKFTQALAAACERAGVRFLYGHDIDAIRTEGRSINGVDFSGRVLKADRYVLCLGSFSAVLARQIGLHLPIYPVKGYSATIPVEGWNGAPTASLVDEKRKIGFSRLGNRLRIAGTAEFAGYNRSLSTRRGEMLLAGLREMFPSLPADRPALQWTGLRPMTPDARPLLGFARYDNLVVNSGHGTLGWTLACGSARLTAELVASRKPSLPTIDLAPLRYS